MKRILLLADAVIITQFAAPFIYTWRYNWRLFRRTETWRFWTTQLPLNHFTAVQNTLNRVRKF